MIDSKTLVLTNLIPDKEKQNNHDSTIISWLNLESKGISVLKFLEDVYKHKDLSPEDSIKVLTNTIKTVKPKIIDASRDHYWREVIEEDCEVEIEHNPYPNEIFQ